MPGAQSTLFRPSGPQDLDHMARELSGRGWVVRFEPHAFVPGMGGGHLVLTRPLFSTAELIVTCPRRHEIHAWVRSGGRTWSLGTVPDVDEVSDLMRRHVRAPGPAPAGREAGARPAVARPDRGVRPRTGSRGLPLVEEVDLPA